MEVLSAFTRATDIYPPALISMLPIGVTALETLGQDDEALRLVGKWVRFAYRTRGADFHPKPAPHASLEAALTFRDKLGDWANALGKLTPA